MIKEEEGVVCMNQAKVLVIVGPTAVGKTALGIQLAQDFNGEIISGDSLQVYQTLDIGTAKATLLEQAQAVHHLIDIRLVNETYSVADFQQEARKLIKSLQKQRKLPIIVGGTGLYIQALLEDFSLGSKNRSFSFRDKYENILKEKGRQVLWKMLLERDLIAAEKISMNNPRRVIRALEVLEVTGKSIFSFKEEGRQLYDTYLIGLMMSRDKLYEKINRRVDIMMHEGLLQEAESLFELGETQASQGIGYKEFFPYFRGEVSLTEAVDLVKSHSRKYAKRQLTWFHNRMNVYWYDLLGISENREKIRKDIIKWLSI